MYKNVIRRSITRNRKKYLKNLKIKILCLCIHFFKPSDFESTLTPVYEVNKNSTKYKRFEPNSYGLTFKIIYDEFSKPIKKINTSNPDLVYKNLIQDI